MLHGLPEPQVGGEREDTDQVGQPEARVPIARAHGPEGYESHRPERASGVVGIDTLDRLCPGCRAEPDTASAPVGTA